MIKSKPQNCCLSSDPNLENQNTKLHKILSLKRICAFTNLTKFNGIFIQITPSITLYLTELISTVCLFKYFLLKKVTYILQLFFFKESPVSDKVAFISI